MLIIVIWKKQFVAETKIPRNLRKNRKIKMANVENKKKKHENRTETERNEKKMRKKSNQFNIFPEWD